ncbi:MAG: PKD domain-containing protein [Bacteroidia bacterium]
MNKLFYITFVLFLIKIADIKADCSTVKAGFTTSSTLICGPVSTSISFVNISTGSNAATATYNWYLNGNSFATTTGLTVPAVSTISAVGVYNYMLVAKANNCYDTAIVKVIIAAKPTASFTAVVDGAFCGRYIFKSTSTDTAAYTTYTWNFGDGKTATGKDTIHNYAAAGPYTATLTVSNSGTCTSTATQSFTIPALPDAKISATGSVKDCSGVVPKTIMFNNNSINPGSMIYTWKDNDKITPYIKTEPTTVGQSLLFNTLGTYVLTIIATNAAGCSTSDSITIVNDKVPVVNPLTISNPEICNNNSTIITPTASTTQGINYTWDFGDGFITTTSVQLPAPTHIYKTPGCYNIKLTAKNACGEASSPAARIIVKGKPKPSFTFPPSVVCIGDKINFINTPNLDACGAIPLYKADSWAWDFGDNQTSTLENPASVTYTKAGAYSVKLTETNNSCGTSVFTGADSVFVSPKPKAIIKSSTLSGCSLFTPTITSISVGEGLTYKWYVDGVLQAQTTISISPPLLAPGGTSPLKHTIRLEIANTCGTDTATIILTALPKAVALFEPNNINICAGGNSPISFTQKSIGDSLIYNWDFGNGKNSTAATPPPQIYPDKGVYTVKLKIIGTCGVDSFSRLITVLPSPDPPISKDTTICGSIATLRVQNIGAVYQWYTDSIGGTLLGTGPTYTTPLLTTATSYYVQATVNNCSSKRTKVTVNIALPVAPPTVDSTNTCSSTKAVIVATAPTGTFQWFTDPIGGAVIFTGPAYTTPIFSSGNRNYYVQVTVNGCTSPRALAHLNVNPIPVLTVIPNMAVCAGNQVTLAVTMPIAAYKYQWYDSLTGGNLIHTDSIYKTPVLTKDTTFYVQASALGCVSARKAIKITVTPKPISDFTFNSLQICENAPIVFTNKSTTGTYKWNFGDGTNIVTTTSPTHSFFKSGTYNVQLTVTLNGCVDSIPKTIVVNPKPIAAFTSSIACLMTSTQFTDSSSFATDWQWNFGDASPFDNTKSPSHIYPIAGSYPVKLVVKNSFGCADSITKKITVLIKPKASFNFTNVCAKQQVVFTNITLSSTATSWNWNFGDGITSVVPNATHTYLNGGTYNVQLIVSNGVGCADTIKKEIVINTIPTPLFTANSTCQDLPTVFKDLSKDSAAIKSWFYDFGDGNNSVSQNPTYIYATSGTYTVTLTVTNVHGCDSSFKLPITVNSTPLASYTVDTVCVGAATTFTSTSNGNPTAWKWDFGDGTVGTLGPITKHVYAKSGLFSSYLKVSNGAQCSGEASKIVFVSGDAVAAIEMKDTACLNEMVVMRDKSVILVGSILSQTWDFGDGSPIETTAIVSHSYKTPGTFYIRHEISAGACESGVIDTLVIQPLPTAVFTVTNTCENQKSIFKDKSQGDPIFWKWNFGDGDTSSVQNPTHLYKASGLFSATLTIKTKGGCIGMATQQVKVFSKPNVSFSNNTVCWGDSTQFINTASPVDGFISGTWWDFNDGQKSTQFSPKHVLIAKKDTFNVRMAIVTSYGCSDTVYKKVVTLPNPKFMFSPSEISGCEPFTTTFNDSSTVKDGTINNWLWNFGDGSLTFTKHPTHTYKKAGKYFLSLTVTTSYGCRMSDTLKSPVVIYPTPKAEFTASSFEASIYEPHIQFKDESIGATLWDWQFGDNQSSVSQSPYYTYSDTGLFIVTHIAFNQYGCNDTVTHTIRIKEETAVFIPNAFSPDDNGLNDIFLPKFSGIKEFHMLIFDRWGSQVFKSDDMNIGWNGRFNGTGELLKQDVYIYKIQIRNILRNKLYYKGSVTLIGN